MAISNEHFIVWETRFELATTIAVSNPDAPAHRWFTEAMKSGLTTNTLDQKINLARLMGRIMAFVIPPHDEEKTFEQLMSDPDTSSQIINIDPNDYTTISMLMTNAGLIKISDPETHKRHAPKVISY